MAEVKETPIINVEEAYSKTELYIEENKKSILIILGAIIALVGGFFLWKYWYVAGQEEEARNAMYHAEQFFEQDSLKLAINGVGEGDDHKMGFVEIADEYGVTKAGNLAHYYLGIAYLRTGEYQNAIDQLEEYDPNDQIVSTIATGAIGDAYMELNNVDEAISYYLKAAEQNKNNFSSPIYLKKAGLAYEQAGKYDDAVKVYEQIRTDFSSTTEGRDIEKYLSRAKALSESK